MKMASGAAIAAHLPDGFVSAGIDVVERVHIFLVRDLDLAVLTALEQLCLCRAPANVGSSNYELGITPGPLSGQLAIVASSTFRCWATNAAGVCVSQLDREISS